MSNQWFDLTSVRSACLNPGSAIILCGALLANSASAPPGVPGSPSRPTRHVPPVPPLFALTDRAAPDSFGDFFRISGTGATIITFSA